MRIESPLLIGPNQAIVMVDCMVNIDRQRLEVGWVAFRTGNHSPTVVMADSNGKVQCEIELPINRRHFLQDVQQHSPDESIYFSLTQNYLQKFKGTKEL